MFNVEHALARGIYLIHVQFPSIPSQCHIQWLNRLVPFTSTRAILLLGLKQPHPWAQDGRFFSPCQANQTPHKLGSSNSKCVLIRIRSMTRMVVVPAWTHRAKRATLPTKSSSASQDWQAGFITTDVQSRSSK